MWLVRHSLVWLCSLILLAGPVRQTLHHELCHSHTLRCLGDLSQTSTEHHCAHEHFHPDSNDESVPSETVQDDNCQICFDLIQPNAVASTVEPCQVSVPTPELSVAPLVKLYVPASASPTSLRGPPTA